MSAPHFEGAGRNACPTLAAVDRRMKSRPSIATWINIALAAAGLAGGAISTTFAYGVRIEHRITSLEVQIDRLALTLDRHIERRVASQR
jgi:hypothetical protein